ncbi:alginate lyase family protein [Pontiella agarivorans]|uniref:Alginate lyase family protein n=1 Tax=Pontiella agarivorans TaxID=3038953 RepID=A0ABU5MSE5_9BACT|nr:alginate lyase family protein [Pontiella agarivorans]MDZ8117052.1 alginate lyase family protein [Pontiella agarivorans]
MRGQSVICGLMLGASVMAPAADEVSEKLQWLLPRLNIPEVESVEDPTEQAVRLLNYYKNRTSVTPPVSTEWSTDMLSDKDLNYANDALKHIFVGQPAYDSYFCGDDINWASRPVPDNEWVWQLNRMYFWNAMGRVYAATRDEKYADEWTRQLVHWVNNNPRDEEHAYAWRSIEAGKRGQSWSSLYFQFIQSPHFDEETLVCFLSSLHDHADFLMKKYRAGSNWALMEAEGLAFIAILFPEFKRAEQWRAEAIRRFNQEIEGQVYPDGHQRELAMGYHVGSINWFFRTWRLAKRNGLEDEFSTSYMNRIERMCEVPMKLCLPDGTNAQFGDAWAGTPGQYAGRFKEWSQMFGRADFLYMATAGKEGRAPDKTAFALPDSGLYSMRSGWDSDALGLVLKCGPDGGSHCQRDNGTFTLAAGGRTLMPDSGSYMYNSDKEGRAWFRQTKVHQTLTLNGQNIDYAPKLLKWEPGEGQDILVVENKSYPNLTHRRAVIFVDKRYFVIVDEAIGPATGNVEIHFQLAPGGAVFDTAGLSVNSDFKDGWNVLVKAHPQKGLVLAEEEGQVSFVYARKEKRPAFCYRLKKEDDRSVRLVTLVVPYENEEPEVSVRRLDVSAAGNGELMLELNEGGKTKNVGLRL